MRERKLQKRFVVTMALSLIAVVLITGCNLSSSNSIPPTPTMVELEIPILTAETEDDMAGEESEVISDEEESQEEDTFESASPTETPKPQPTATQEPEAEAAVEETIEAEEIAEEVPTPTRIPYVTTANSDPMVMIYGTTNCYESPDLEADVIGVASGGTALGAFNRDWNWYKVVHPTTGGLVCWVTGESIRPNQSAYQLGN